jgi:hypothetical protein
MHGWELGCELRILFLEQSWGEIGRHVQSAQPRIGTVTSEDPEVGDWRVMVSLRLWGYPVFMGFIVIEGCQSLR